jgi:hypothetical protein
MDRDFTHFFLFVALSLLVLVLVFDQRPSKGAADPLDPTTPVDQVPTEQSLKTTAAFANNPSNFMPPPLSLVMPKVGVQPLSGGCDGS